MTSCVRLANSWGNRETMNAIASYLPELWLRLGEHILLTGASTLAAILIAVPLGIAAARVSILKGPVLGAVGILQTVPSLAMLAFLLVLTGKIGATPAVIALTLYALLPIVRNTVTGIDGVPEDAIEAANSIGMTSTQRLWLVELPLAKNVMIAGIRTAAVIGVGIATLAAFIGAGGLGQFINRGLALLNTDLILLGAVPAAALALMVDGSIQAFAWGLDRRRAAGNQSMRILATMAPALLLAIGVIAFATGGTPIRSDSATVRISSKNFTEQLILAEMMAQLIEAHTDLNVERRAGLGGTMIVHEALVRGEIDIYAEYSGTALTVILSQPVISDPDAAFEFVREAYEAEYDLLWLSPFGFTNTHAVCLRRAHADANGWERISDLTQDDPLRAGFGPEFAERADGLPGLLRAYPGLNIASIQDVDPSIMYSAVATGEVDVIAAFSTDGRIQAFDLVVLEDDRGYFPPYYPSPVVRQELIDAHPEVARALERLGGTISNDTMRNMNYRVDEGGETPAAVAREFLDQNGLLLASP